MLRPSYSELMDILNDDRDLDSEITSRYTIVIAAAKRARQIVGGASYEVDQANKTDKAVSIAVEELESGLIKLYPDGLPNQIAAAKREMERQRNARYAEKISDLEEEAYAAHGEESGYVFEPDDYDALLDEDDDELLGEELGDDISDELDAAIEAENSESDEV